MQTIRSNPTSNNPLERWQFFCEDTGKLLQSFQTREEARKYKVKWDKENEVEKLASIRAPSITPAKSQLHIDIESATRENLIIGIKLLLEQYKQLTEKYNSLIIERSKE